jgi:hypothetical protein
MAKPGFATVKTWLVGLTSVLVVIPAVINAGLDIYASLAKLPKSEAERTNVALFQKYFNKQPVAAFPVPIKQSNGTVEVRFSIYEEGDVFVEFGRFTQWFPFPGPAPAPVAFSVIGEAHAQANAAVKGFGSYQQTDRMQGNAIVRERAFENGVTEKYVLNPASGDILEFSARRDADANVGPGVAKLAPIDLDAIRQNRLPPQGRAAVCVTRAGSCQLQAAVAASSQCFCATATGAIGGVAK